mmetsp:Transcript_54976/g.112294  ORF Transcript_54976/g.112294 Transcript_54976/m.112294 type:complete len:95 (+) Transcript_54976:998-1282(+)
MGVGAAERVWAEEGEVLKTGRWMPAFCRALSSRFISSCAPSPRGFSAREEGELFQLLSFELARTRTAAQTRARDPATTLHRSPCFTAGEADVLT